MSPPLTSTSLYCSMNRRSTCVWTTCLGLTHDSGTDGYRTGNQYIASPAPYRLLWRQNIKLVSLCCTEKPVCEIRRCGDCWPLHEKFSCEKIESYDHCFALSVWVLSDCSLTVCGMLKACTVCWSDWYWQELLCTAEADEWPVVWLLLTNIR